LIQLKVEPSRPQLKHPMCSAHQNQVYVWDMFVRLFYWTLVAAFTIAYFTEDDLLRLHVWAGYVVGALIVARVVWGFIGPVIQMATSGLSANQRMRADIHHGPEPRLHQQAGYISARPTSHRRKSLATRPVRTLGQ
jgi:cytochrome b